MLLYTPSGVLLSHTPTFLGEACLFHLAFLGFFSGSSAYIPPRHQTDALHMPRDSGMDVTRMRKHIQNFVCIRKHIYKIPVVGNLSTPLVRAVWAIVIVDIINLNRCDFLLTFAVYSLQF